MSSPTSSAAPAVHDSRPLREGFTTGTAATAAAMAALHLILTGKRCEKCTVYLPPLDATAPHLSIPVLVSDYGYGYGCPPAPCNASPARIAWAEVEKDGGDDPDATRHAHIVATVILPAVTPLPSQAHVSDTGAAMPTLCSTAPNIRITGGAGVGRVTLPGLPIGVGQAAINPVPLQQITHALTALALRHNYRGPMEVCIAVPHGEELARRTLNARLGIVGGISILGTQGTVKPFSHSAWKATISQGLSVAEASHCQQICLSTGRRSEKLLMGQYPHLPPQAFIQAADFAQFSLHEAGQRSFSHIAWGCFFGKLLKLAEGHPYTHAHSAELDMRVLAELCAEHKAACAPAVAQCVTAGHALELLLDDSSGKDILHSVAERAAHHAQKFAGKKVRIHLFHIQGQELLAV